MRQEAPGPGAAEAVEGVLGGLDRGLWAAGGPPGTLLAAVGIALDDVVTCRQVRAPAASQGAPWKGRRLDLDESRDSSGAPLISLDCFGLRTRKPGYTSMPRCKRR